MTSIATSTTYSELEIQAELPLEASTTAIMSMTDSFVYMMERLVSVPFIPIKTKKGEEGKVLASSIGNKKNVERFLENMGLAGLLRLSWIADRALHEEYGRQLRARKGSPYALIAESDIDLMDTICLYALLQQVVWNKREKKAFIDTDAAMKAETAYLLRNERKNTFQGIEHVKKHGLSPEEAASHMRSIHDQRRGQVVPMISGAGNE
jgi:hypothetical protein